MDRQGFEAILAEAGGIRPLKRDGFHPLNEQEIVEIEDYAAAKLPADYRDFLMHVGGAAFCHLVSFRSITPLPTCEPGGVEPFSSFYGSEREGFRALLSSIQLYRIQGRIPKELIPIGDNMFADQICLAITGEDRGRVFFWDHENERCERDYWDSHGASVPVPREFLYGNVYLVATDFIDFLKRIVKDKG